MKEKEVTMEAYDFTKISSSNSGLSALDDDAGQETILSDVPSQTSYHSKNSAISQHDRELRSFPLAMVSKSLFLVACAMFLWLSIDDLYWANESQNIPESVLEADDDLTWRQYRSRQEGRTAGDSSASDIGWHRPSTAGTTDAGEDEITWSELRNSDGNDRLLLRSRDDNHQYHRRQQNDAAATFQTPWAELTFSDQIAATTLGYNETTWDQGLPVFTDIIPWESLTPEQEAAAVTLGYDQYLWDLLRGFSEETDMAPIDSSTNAANPASEQTEWGQFLWDDLPEEIRTEAAMLGYDESLWNNGERTSTDGLFWDQLTSEQQDAATVLGYTKETWDVFVNPVGSSTTPTSAPANPPADSSSETASVITPNPTSITISGEISTNSSTTEQIPGNVNWRDFEWQELPTEIKGDAISLGFTESLWNSGAGVATDQYFWDELSPTQQNAATNIFGYTETTWNASNNKWQKVGWDNLPPNIQSAAEILGYNKDLWNEGAKIDARSYDWDVLSEEQQQAAFKVFGMTEQTWSSAALKDNEGDVENNGGGRGAGRGAADDDYVFTVGDDAGNNEVSVSKYQIIYFVASICLILVGVIDIIRERRWFHILMVLAGVFSLLASMWVETNLQTSDIFNCFSMHFLLFQGITAFYYRPHLRVLLPGPCKNALWMADISFTLGALMGSVLSFFFFKDDARENLRIARTDSFAAILFLLTAVIYIFVTPIAFARSTKHNPYK